MFPWKLIKNGLKEAWLNEYCLTEEVDNETTYQPLPMQSWVPFQDSLTPNHTWNHLTLTTHIARWVHDNHNSRLGLEKYIT